APTFMLAPDNSIPTDISRDGSIVVGAFDNKAPVFRWNLNDGTFENLGGQMNGSVAISDGGKIVADELDADGIFHPAIFEDATGWTLIPPVAGAVACNDGSGATYGSAFGISGDGNTVVGLSYGSLGCSSSTVRGFKWTAAGGSVALPKVNSFATAGRANAVS